MNRLVFALVWLLDCRQRVRRYVHESEELVATHHKFIHAQYIVSSGKSRLSFLILFHLYKWQDAEINGLKTHYLSFCWQNYVHDGSCRHRPASTKRIKIQRRRRMHTSIQKPSFVQMHFSLQYIMCLPLISQWLAFNNQPYLQILFASLVLFIFSFNSPNTQRFKCFISKEQALNSIPLKWSIMKWIAIQAFDLY